MIFLELIRDRFELKEIKSNLNFIYDRYTYLTNKCCMSEKEIVEKETLFMVISTIGEIR